MQLKLYPRPRAIFSFFFFLFLFPCFLFSQTTPEICDNGIDDDGDGLIDCYDQDCTCTGQCDNFYYTTCNADCYYVPPCDTISLGVQWVAQAETGTYSPLVAGDMDKDGIPDIVTYRVEQPDIYILDGATGATKIHIIAPTTFPGGTAPAIADLDHDGFGELVLVGEDRILRCWNHDGTLAFASTIQVGYSGLYRFSVPNIADFDHDGWAEINIGNQVYSGQTGALLAQGGSGVSAGEHPARKMGGFSFCSPVAMDVLPDNFCPDCAGLEIVAGNQVLSVNLVTGAVTPIVTAAAPFTDGFTSIADFDRDGDLDAIVQGRRGGQNYVYCWDIQTSTILRQFKLPNNWADGASRVNIADLDGDGQLEISFVAYPTLFALKNDFTPLWSISTTDASSITCSSVFDFCGDGSSDVIYRGQNFLQVLEGATGQVKWEDNCVSETHIENPLVLDVDNDGQTEIVIECGSGGGSPQLLGTVVCYEALGLPGISSRKVWNQHGYFNTNINDDLSVPRYQQNPSIVGDSLRLNGFMNQFFNPTFPTPDGALTIQSVVCTGDSLVLSATLCNLGDNVLPPQTPLSAYVGNPQTSAALWAGSRLLGFSLPKDSCFAFTLRLPRLANDSVFVVLNDNHSQPPPFNLATDFPVTTIGECSFTNNIAAFYYEYKPYSIDLGPDTAICANTVLGLNADGNDLISWQWSGVSSTNPTIIAPGPGTYAVTATDVCGITQTDQIIISTDATTVVNIGPDQAICQGETVTLGESGFDTYNWSPGASVNCTTCANVTAAPATSGLVILQASFANGCTNRDSVYITVYDTSNYKVDTTICYGRSVTWNNVVIEPDSNHTFHLSSVHGCDSTFQIRVKGSTIGTYQIKVDTAVCLGKSLNYNNITLQIGEEKIFNLPAITGCDSTVQVKVLPKDTFATAEIRTVCAGDTSLIFGQNQTASGVFRSTFLAKNGCDSSHTVDLTVLPPLLVAIDATPTCFNEATGVLATTASGQEPPFNYHWNTTSANVPDLEGLPAANYSLTVTDAKDCTQTATAQVTAYPPILFAADPDSTRCFGENSGRIQISSPDTTLLYSLNGNAFSQTLLYGDLPAANYTLYAEDIYGCVDTITVPVRQPPKLQVFLPGDTSLVLGESLLLQTQTFGFSPVRYTWADTSYLSCGDCPDPVATPLTNITYLLTITDQNGCTASDAIRLQIERIIGVFVPNAFAPDHNTNNRLELNFGPAIRIVRSFRVYDRWGALLHEVQDAPPNDPIAAWNGTSRGKAVLPGVYIWQLEVELVDGTMERYQGDVTVLR
ncbi:MAG: FG-GAP-like repeat-containing protein [Saprospiraceae bacterium]